MGLYVNVQAFEEPPSVKLEWLQANRIPGRDLAISSDALPVCLVFNRSFAAAAIAYNKEEFLRFSQPDDPRLKYWFMVPRERLRLVSDLAKWEAHGQA